ncbi:hypothetical protein L1987_30703 [Smallanthus sonchifolius]|uniref:Uncharacterized protein n=1 Tax=Smallanthus sonchifolius TaxID=185202 RepID=A0ACB9I479_9ASTR|nr:hypothetical protein L1987_30703 [Smallanthus sonchifolius]
MAASLFGKIARNNCKYNVFYFDVVEFMIEYLFGVVNAVIVDEENDAGTKNSATVSTENADAEKGQVEMETDAVKACWAYASVSRVEALHFMATGKSVALSVQQIRDSVKVHKCSGGRASYAFQPHVQKEKSHFKLPVPSLSPLIFLPSKSLSKMPTNPDEIS